jgi:hypothetical protein
MNWEIFSRPCECCDMDFDYLRGLPKWKYGWRSCGGRVFKEIWGTIFWNPVTFYIQEQVCPLAAKRFEQVERKEKERKYSRASKRKSWAIMIRLTLWHEPLIPWIKALRFIVSCYLWFVHLGSWHERKCTVLLFLAAAVKRHGATPPFTSKIFKPQEATTSQIVHLW